MKTILSLNQSHRAPWFWPALLAVGGCLLAGPAVMAQDTPAEAPNSHPTYLRDIQPIFMGSCSRCHNQETRFVYNWLDYKTAYADRWEIRRRLWDSYRGRYYKEPMPIVNSPESLAISDADRALIKAWVDQGGVRGEVPPPGAAKSKGERIQLGKRLFNSICAACHQPTGRGLPNVFPPLAGSDFLNADKARAIKLVMHGRQGEVVVNGLKFNNNMPAFPLNDQDIANVLSYVYNSFGNSGLDVTADEVKALRAQPADTGTPSPAKAAAPSAFE